MVKTLVVLTEVPDCYPKFKIVEGDLRQLNGVYINADDEKEEEQRTILDLFYGGGASGLVDGFSDIAPEAPFDFQYIVHCGFLL